VLAASPPARVLVDGEWTHAALAAGADAVVNDPILLRFMEENGTVDLQPLLESMRQGKVEFLVLNGTIEDNKGQVGSYVQKWSDDVLNIMNNKYRHAFTIDLKGHKVYIYRHRRTND
jgi:hypothetical protein